MDPVVGAALAGGGLSVLGNLLGANAEADAIRAANEAENARYADAVRRQEEFAKMGIQWKVNDAKAAGIHPLFALGAQTHSFSPISVGSTPDTSRASFFKQSGQDISRAVQATLEARDQELSKLQVGMAQAQLDGQLIDNQIKASTLRQFNGVSTAFPGSDNFLPGQGNSPLVNAQPLKKTVSQPGRPAQEAGWRPDVSYSRTDTGLVPMIPESITESLEDDMIGSLLWRIRNQLVPNVSGGRKGKPAPSQLPPGAVDWDWSYMSQEWRPRYKDFSGDKASNVNKFFGGQSFKEFWNRR